MATYYVDPAAGGANDGSDWTNAWVDVQTAFDTAVAGDIVYCRGTQDISTTAIVDVDVAGGDTVTGHIHFIGCDAGGTARAGQFTIDANGGGGAQKANCLNVADFDRLMIENFSFTGASGDGVIVSAGNPEYWVWRQCAFYSNGGDGFDGANKPRFGLFIRCVAYSNVDGFANTGTTMRFVFCTSRNNSSEGWNYNSGVTYIGCLCFENTTDNLSLYSQNMVFGCVFDGCTNGSGVLFAAARYGNVIIGCRGTNNGDHGIEQGAAVGESNIEDWNLFHNNTNGDLQNIVGGIHSYGDDGNHIADPAGDGYVNAGGDDYELDTTATHRRTAVQLDWDLGSPTVAYYVAGGLVPTDTPGVGGVVEGAYAEGAWL